MKDETCKDAYVGIDTSCYTTSVACVGRDGIVSDLRTMLSVRMGERGLRQSEGVFQHIRNLDALLPQFFSELEGYNIRGVGVSVKPRDAEDSYMPVFLAGKMAAQAIAGAKYVLLHECSHQSGHVRAALHGNEQLMGKPFIALQLSGGTTELLLADEKMQLQLLGGTNDISCGQFVDRVGVSMGLPFPSGKHMEVLAKENMGAQEFILPISVNGLNCSFSGVETKAQQLLQRGVNTAALAYAVYDCIACTLCCLIDNAFEANGVSDFLLAGGVASSMFLREMLLKRQSALQAQLHFAQSKLAGDNAVGAAFLAMDSITMGD